MSKVNAFFKRKDIEVSLKRYGIDALGAMAQGLFCTLLVGTILDTLGTQLGISFLAQPLIKIGETGYTIGKFASAMVGPAMAVAIGYALHAPAMVLAHPGRLCDERHGRRGRTACRLCCCDSRSRVWQNGLEGD